MDHKIQDKLQKLFASYTEDLPGKLSQLAMQWQDLSSQFSSKKLDEFHRSIHSLCGSAGTYGYITLSKSARTVEIYLKSILGSHALTTEQQITITKLMIQLQATPLQMEEKKFAISTEQTAPCVDKLIYALDHDDDFIQDLKKDLFDAHYVLVRLKNFDELLERLKQQKLPAALVVDTDFLNDKQIEDLLTLQKQSDIVVPLFCTAKQGDLLTRLRAVRAGSIAFLQKPVDTFYLTKKLELACGFSPTEPFRILIVDDSESLAEYYRLILQGAGMIASAISNPLLAMDAMIEFQPDLLLLDIYMPEVSGIELAAVLRQEPRYTHIPIIFLSSEEDKFKQLAALSLGGDDFLTKPILPQHLVAAVKSRAERAGILSSYMMRDSLTGLLNHSNILHQLEIELTRALRHDLPLLFVMLDIDHFKKVNDKYGHSMGDKVLKKLSELLLTRLRKTDYVGRYGGEEFAIIMTDTTKEDCSALLNDLRELFYRSPFKSGGIEFHVSFSAGVAGFPELTAAPALIEAADQALYRAKQNGRNKIEI